MNDEGKKILSQLSKRQQEAVSYIDGPLLVLAGAGSGKTRVLTHKIAWLAAEKIAKPENIMAVTFTNKAAGEMKSRINMLLSGESAAKINAGTFHGYGLRFLFRHMKDAQDIIGLHEGFAVFDRNDSRALVQQIMKEKKFPEGESSPAAVLELIARDYMARTPDNSQESELEENIYLIAKEYRKRLRELNAVDFDDLMILPLEILKQSKEIRLREQAKIKWLLVDEYQDVNYPQYLLLRYLVSPECVINVVGDPDQSIYGWRGAELRMILNFEHDFDGAKTIVLDENYRSTGNILNASNALIRNNTERLKKDLHTSRGAGEKIYTLLARNDFQEADFIVSEIEKLIRVQNYNYNDIAILYRQNAMSRVYEQKFLENQIPYRIIRGVSFYDRKEVRDVLSILKFALNPLDRPSLERVASFAIKGMGQARCNDFAEWAKSQESVNEPSKFWSLVLGGAWNVKGALNETMKNFASHMCAILEIADEGIRPAVDYVLDDMNYKTYLKETESETWQDRIENVKELKSIVPDGKLSETLAEAALFTDADTSTDDDDSVGLLTLHASKGLEFPVVFLVGMEEDIFPHSKAKDDPSELEEERRLCYVGMTRAEERLYLTAARSRRLYGGIIQKGFSRFLFEIPDECKKIDDRGPAPKPKTRQRTFYSQNRRGSNGGYSTNRGYWGW
ncbi:MAG: UvrD-helicase domain-containing protein [Synergistaceae bacterium]|nr:UvrD-helicase domain-containing protein [Synergistaceae bacterium]